VVVVETARVELETATIGLVELVASEVGVPASTELLLRDGVVVLEMGAELDREGEEDTVPGNTLVSLLVMTPPSVDEAVVLDSSAEPVEEAGSVVVALPASVVVVTSTGVVDDAPLGVVVLEGMGVVVDVSSSSLSGTGHAVAAIPPKVTR
jgi:hypothetical protein